jgi:hypothetical protein
MARTTPQRGTSRTRMDTYSHSARSQGNGLIPPLQIFAKAPQALTGGICSGAPLFKSLFEGRDLIGGGLEIQESIMDASCGGGEFQLRAFWLR